MCDRPCPIRVGLVEEVGSIQRVSPSARPAATTRVKTFRPREGPCDRPTLSGSESVGRSRYPTAGPESDSTRSSSSRPSSKCRPRSS